MATSASFANDMKWVDVTKRFVKNPAFDNDSQEGWTWESNASTQAVRVNCISFFNGHFNLHQQLKLPKGHYRLSVQGFYRTGDNASAYSSHQNGSETITASLYAGSASKLLVSLYSASMNYNAASRCWEMNGRYYPDGKEAAEAAFDEGLYWNNVEFDADGEVTIGVVCSEYNGNNYCVLDNFKLEYAGGADPSGNAWIDMTDQLITNPGFDSNSTTGWTWDSNANSQTARCECMEFWNGTFDIHQTIKDAPQGRYRLSVQSYYRCGDNNWAYNNYKNNNENITAYFYAGSNEQKLASVYSESMSSNPGGDSFNGDGKYFPNTMESARIFFDNGMYWNEMEFEAGGDFTIGIKCSQSENSNWCIFDNWKLEYYGDVVSVGSIEVTADQTELVVGETTTVHATVLPVNVTLPWVDWSSSNEQVATVDEDGLVTAVGEGKVNIMATAIDGSGTTGTVVITVARNPATSESLLINEIMVSNVDEYLSPAFNFDGWMELYNPTAKPVELEGLRLSDPDNGEGPWAMPQGMGIVPAKGFRVVWFDSNNIAPTNAPFKLDTDGGTIVITDANGTVIVEQAYPAGMERVSYARQQDGTGEWGLTGQATPGSSNNGVLFAQKQLAAPSVDKPSMLFSGQLSVQVDIPAGCTLRYTIDGTLPTLTNGSSSSKGSFNVKGTSVYRFRLFADDKLPSPVTSRSYILRDKNYTLPVIAVVTDNDFLYSTEIGVMAKGPNGRPGNGQSEKCNWNMDWERPVNFSYLTADGEMVLNQDVNLEMCGGWSRAWEPHAFKLKGNKELGGDKNLVYPFFEQKPYIRNRTLQIRNGGNDNQCRFKDPSLQYMVGTSGIDVDYQSYQPTHEFINGKYIGVLNMREPNNKHYVYANYGWDDEVIDQFEMSPDSGYVQKCGTAEAFNHLVDLSEKAADAATYAEIMTLLDVDAYANYMATELYLGNWDWPQNNVKGFRYRDGGKFRFVLFDLDGSFSTDTPFDTFFNKEYYQFDKLYPSGKRITDDIRFVTLFKNMLKNDDFRRQFIDAYCLMGGSVFEKNRASAIIDELLERVEPAMNLETVWSWGASQPNSASGTANTVRNQLNSRLSTATTALKNYSAFGLRNVTAQRVTLNSDTGEATILINGQAVPTGKFDGNLFAPVTLQALAPAGYVFSGWKNKQGVMQSTASELSLPTGTVYLTACFTPLSDSQKQAQGITPVRINEVSGANDSYIDEYGKKGDWLELYNTTDKEIDVEGMYLTDNLSKPTKYQITKGDTKAKTTIPAHGYLIIWCDNKRATTDNGIHASFKISDDGGQLQLMAADESWTDVITYGAHDANTTVVRYPDGASDVYATNVPTIGRSNVKTSYMTAVSQQGGETSIHNSHLLTFSPSQLRLRYAASQLILHSEDAEQVALAIYTADGCLVEKGTVSFDDGETARVDVSHLASGFYVARATDRDGQPVSCKFLK